MKQVFCILDGSRRGWGALALLVATAIVTSGATAAAEVYTWKDENGVVHYSDSPPDSGVSETVQVGEIYRPGTSDAYVPADQPAPEPAAGSGDTGSQPPPSAAQQRRDQIAQERAKRREAQAEADRLCALHRQRLEQMEPSRRVFYSDENGESVRMDDEQRVRLVEESRAFLAQNCGG